MLFYHTIKNITTYKVTVLQIRYLSYLAYLKKTKMIRTANAVWSGTGKEGNGHITTQSNFLDKVQYSYSSRFEDAIGTNPEELIAAAHAGCFTMKLSFVLGAAGFIADRIETKCEIELGDGSITKSHLTVIASIKAIDEATFQACVKDAAINCPVSRLLNTAISSTAILV